MKNNQISKSVDPLMIRENDELINILLKDQTTDSNIKWGTKSYKQLGVLFSDNKEMRSDLITGWYEGVIRPRATKEHKVKLDRQRNRAEVFTPSWIIKLQVEAAIDSLSHLSFVEFMETRWMEITCGEGPYMANRYDMATGEINPLSDRSGFVDYKFKLLNNQIDNKEVWVTYAINIFKSSYGYEYQGDSLLIARENLILTFIDNYFYKFGAFPSAEHLSDISTIISHNVFQMDGLTYDVPYSSGGHGNDIQLSLFDDVEMVTKKPALAELRWWPENKTVTYKELTKKDGAEMKFDVVIGNPPYQGVSSEGNKNYSKPVYPDFMDSAYEIGTKVILITPARFLFNAGATKKSWNSKMLKDKYLKVLHYESDSTKVFNNTDIKGGVVVTYRDEDKEVEPIEVFIPSEKLRQAISKVSRINNSSLRDISVGSAAYSLTQELIDDFPENKEVVSRGVGYGVKTNIFDKLNFIFFQNKPDNSNDEYIQLFGRIKSLGRVYRWTKSNYIAKPSNFEYWKVIVPHSNGDGTFGEVLSKPRILEPNVGHTQTFMSFGSFNNLDEAESCLKYIKSKFSRAMLGVLKITQHNPPSTWEKVPLQDFTKESDIDWSKSISEIDQQLYEKYGLNQEEINFIETNVKEMD